MSPTARRLSRAAIRLLVLPLLFAQLGGRPAAAQALGPQLQDATISGRGSTITVKHLPVRTPAGVVYRDITIQLKLDATGGVRARASGSAPAPPSAIAHDVTVGQITETATAPDVAAPFTAGLYRDDAHGGFVRLINQGRRVFGDFPTWALSAAGGETVLGGAEWFGGPLRISPYRSRVERAGITADTYSFGVVTSSGPDHFDQGMLIGAVQTGKALTIVSYHRRGCCTYAATPTSQITYTLIGR